MMQKQSYAIYPKRKRQYMGFYKPAHTALLSTSALSSRQTVLLAGLAFAFAGFSGISDGYAVANPSSLTTISGNVTSTLTSPGHLLTTETTNTGIIQGQNVDVLSGESWRILQPSQSSSLLVRVTGGSPTEILGDLTANGHVVLVNSQGVFFGQGSQVNVAGIIASTADISNKNFNAGNYKFDKAGNPTASIVNLGTITAADGGLVALVAPGVSNQGIISAKTVALGAGDGVALDLYGDNLYSFQVTKTSHVAKDQNGNDLGAAITNSGTISAHTVYLTANAAKEVVNQAINTTGIIEATAAHVQGGTIVLDGGEGAVTVAGTLDVSGKQAGQKGGKVKIAGGSIDLASGSVIDASGSAAGGTVLVGYDSRHPHSMKKAKNTVVEKGAVIDVSSTAGKGGYAEVSGDSVVYEGVTNATGPAGFGSLVIDPGDWTIWTGANGADTINNLTLDGQLNTANVVIDTTAGTNNATPNIYVNAPVSWTGAGSLTLNAGKDIDVSSNIISGFASGAGKQGAITMNADTLGGGGNINIGTYNGNVQVSTVNGNLTLSATGPNDNINLGSTVNPANIGLGNVLLQTGSGTLQANSGKNINIGALDAGTTTVHSNTGGITLSADSSLNLNAPVVGTTSVNSANGGITIHTHTLNLNSILHPGTASIFTTTGNTVVFTTLVNLTGGSTMSAGNDLQLFNNGVFYSDTKYVLTGSNVELNQNVGGSIQNAINAINPTSNVSTLTVGDGNFNENLTIDGNSGHPVYTVSKNFTLTSKHGAGSTKITGITPGTPVIAVNNGNTVAIKGLTLDGGPGAGNTGIAVTNSNGITIGDNTGGANIIENMSGAGISADSSSNVTVQGNTIDNTAQGITLSGLTGTNLIDNNFIDDIYAGDAIDSSGDTGLTISNNQISIVNGISGNGINLTGDNGVQITGNTISNTATGINIVEDAADSDNSGNITISGNTISDALVGISSDENFGITIVNNTLTGIANTGIQITESENEGIDDNHDIIISDNSITGSNGATGISALNVLNLSVGDATNGGNAISGFTNGIIVSGSENFGIFDNLVTGSGFGNGIAVSGSVGTNNSVTSNTVSGFEDGINVNGSDNLQFASNSISDNGVGVLIANSDGDSFSGDQLFLNNVGIQLDNAQNTTITGVTLQDNDTGLYALNGSGNTLVGSTSFIGGTTDILLDGTNTSLQFSDNASTFDGLATNYYVLQNDAMAGGILDASQQTYSGTVPGHQFSNIRGINFTDDQFNTAESQTVDVLDGGAVGLVFYRPFPTTITSTFNVNLLNQFLLDNNLPLPTSKFSYSGHTIGSDPSQVPFGFSVPETNLSLLAPAAGGTTPPAPGGNLGSLSPSAGPNSFASLAPAAGGAASDAACGNSYLASGGAPGTNGCGTANQ